jgi:hypothetical protein
MYPSGLIKKRKGVGSIIAGAFIVLIILSGYEFYLLNNRTQNEYQQILNDVRDSDLKRSQEDLKFTKISPDFDSDEFEITIRNDGPEHVTLRFAGIFEEGETETQYFELDTNPIEPFDPPNLMPAEIITINLNDESVQIEEDQLYTIHLISNRGNVFPIQYPQDEQDYPYWDIVEGTIEEVIGDVVPKYDSFRIATILEDDLEEELDNPPSSAWDKTWAIDWDNDECQIFKIKITYYGENNLILGGNSALYFNELAGTGYEIAYISYYDPDDNEIKKYNYGLNKIEFLPPNEETGPNQYTLYFATSYFEPEHPTKKFGDPTDKIQFPNPSNDRVRYQVVMGIFEKEPEYSQAFSLIALEVQ